VTLVVALATLTSNILSSLLFAQLPDDPYHLASNFGWYLHFANILSVFGFIGALRQHALSVAIFANYLILDTILCSIPRFLLLSLLEPLSSSICSDPSSADSFSSLQYSQSQSSVQQPAAHVSRPNPVVNSQWESLDPYTVSWTPEGCVKIVYLAQITLAASVIAATLLQFVGALCVREFAKSLWMREIRLEESRLLGSVERRSMAEDRAGMLSPIDEEEGCFEDDNGVEKII